MRKLPVMPLMPQVWWLRQQQARPRNGDGLVRACSCTRDACVQACLQSSVKAAFAPEL